jgi:RNA polymerase sigma-70 factor (ECF subfamily)
MQLLDRIRQDDENAFENFFDTYHARLFFFFRKKTGSDFLAEELVQLTFIKLWDKRHNLDPDIELHVQLFRIARTTLIDKIRTEAVASKRMGLIREQLETTIATASLYEEKEVMERLQLAIDKLPPARRTIFRMNRLEGLTHKEIAHRLQISPRTVEHQISHAVRQLQQWLF